MPYFEKPLETGFSEEEEKKRHIQETEKAKEIDLKRKEESSTMATDLLKEVSEEEKIKQFKSFTYRLKWLVEKMPKDEDYLKFKDKNISVKGDNNEVNLHVFKKGAAKVGQIAEIEIVYRKVEEKPGESEKIYLNIFRYAKTKTGNFEKRREVVGISTLTEDGYFLEKGDQEALIENVEKYINLTSSVVHQRNKEIENGKKDKQAKLAKDLSSF